MEYTIDGWSKPATTQTYNVFCPVSVLISQTMPLKAYYEPLGTPTQKPTLSTANSEYT